MARTLIYALASLSHGTDTLARALTEIGLEGGHEIIGWGQRGALLDLPGEKQSQLYNRGEYETPEGERQYGLPACGDNILAMVAHTCWYPLRGRPFKELDEPLQTGLKSLLRIATTRYLRGSGFFVDISGFLADFFPVLDALEIPSRAIHLTRDGRAWVQKLQFFHGFSEARMTAYGNAPDKKWVYGYPVRWPGTPEGVSTFYAACFYWAHLHRWFLTAKRPIVHCEDYNASETALAVLSYLYPEATLEQCLRFTLHDARYGNLEARERQYAQGPNGFPCWQDWSDVQARTFKHLCGDVMKELGYDY